MTREWIRNISITFIIQSLFLIFCFVGIAGPPAADQWVQATQPRQWSFPQDHGSHPDYRTEWWYFTGNLADESGKQYGYQLTFFRQGIRTAPTDPDNPWSLRDVFLAHFTITNVSRGRFFFAEKTSRTGPGLAGAGRDNMDIWLLNWSARMEDNHIELSARSSGMELKLQLSPVKPHVLHGEGGLSKKGPREGQSSYYYSCPNLKTTGTVKTPGGGTAWVWGTSWFDHEFGSNQLSPEQAGWDWFSLHLSDGRELMIYFLRKKDGALESASSGTLIEKDGSTRHLNLEDIKIAVLGTWKSPRSKGTYPDEWRISVPGAQIELTISPLLADQELVTAGSTGVTYWEGAVRGTGRSGGRSVSAQGYVELTGYAGSMGDLF
jgi:predicted secreted hydrolase